MSQQKRGKYYFNEIAYQVWWHAAMFLFNRRGIRSRGKKSSSNSLEKKKEEGEFDFSSSVLPWDCREAEIESDHNEHSVISFQWLASVFLPSPNCSGVSSRANHDSNIKLLAGGIRCCNMCLGSRVKLAISHFTGCIALCQLSDKVRGFLNWGGLGELKETWSTDTLRV